jgi:hypothetical protein
MDFIGISMAFIPPKCGISMGFISFGISKVKYEQNISKYWISRAELYIM